MDLMDNPLFKLGIIILGVTLLALAVGIFLHAQRAQIINDRIDHLVTERRRVQITGRGSRILKGSSIAESLDQIGEVIEKTGILKYMLDAEERALLGKAGLGTEQWTVRYTLTRTALAVAGFALGYFWLGADSQGTWLFLILLSCAGVGYMSLKWLLQSLAEGRETAFEKELVALVDILRLLAGVGMSTDQAIDIVSTQLRELVPITGKLLNAARPQVQSGVTWLQILRKINQTYTSQDFKGFITVIEQIEKYGGAVQEPLKLFAERMVEKERANSKERMGKLSVKLTGIMVLTTLPALLIITGGPGIISLLNNLGRL
ncbi:MAG: type II secretion system F family protein [Burkholderiales bacterium]|jgi:tight adherence protein C|nr:type II secretion system F family protein [Burkholderiales bacterium]